MNNKIKLNDSIIPAIPFIWYREEEFILPIDHIGTISPEKVKTLYNYDIISDLNIIVQRHVTANANLYICLHSLLFYELHKSNNLDISTILTIYEIPENYCINMEFQVKIIPLNTYQIIDIFEVPGGLKIDEFTSGSVFIHGGAFSPPGCLHFKVNEDKDINEFICFIKCESLNIETCCLFVLFNDLNGTNIDNKVKEYILKIENC